MFDDEEKRFEGHVQLSFEEHVREGMLVVLHFYLAVALFAKENFKTYRPHVRVQFCTTITMLRHVGKM